MSSPCLIRIAAAAGLAAGLAACHASDQAGWKPPRGQIAAPLPAMSQLYPAGPSAQQEPPQLAALANEPAHIANGKRLFSAYNCNGCHFNGGGGIGPAFMDPKWRYGGSLEEIHDSIAEGRPNGMPVWGRMIADAQIWDIAAYVHSLVPQGLQSKPGSTVSPQPETPVSAQGGEPTVAG